MALACVLMVVAGVVSLREMLARFRCSKSPKRPPPFAEVARKACAHGDKRGCE